MDFKAWRRNRRLEQLAYPDPFELAWWRQRRGALLIVAFVLGVAHLYLPALVVLALATPDVWRCNRQKRARRRVLRDRRRAARAQARQAIRMPEQDIRGVFLRR